MSDLINRADALACFHDWVDSKGDVHSADEMAEYQRIEALPSVEPEKALTAEIKLSKEQIQDAVDDAVKKMMAEMEERERKRGGWISVYGL